jgi:PhoH-like ATPase
MQKQKLKQQNLKKIFVFDTNVLIMDPTAFLHMGEHDVVIPLIVIEEVDKLKNKGTSVSVSARQVSANLDAYFGPELYKEGVSLGEGKGNLSIFYSKELHPDVKHMFREDTPDNRILSVAMFVKEKCAREENKQKKQKRKVTPVSVVFVSNDTNLRFKAGSLGLQVEKYRNNAINDINTLYPGVVKIHLNNELISKMYTGETEYCEQKIIHGLPYSEVSDFLGEEAPVPYPYELFIIYDENGEKHLSYFHKNFLYRVENGHKVYGNVSTRNDEQQLAMNILLNPDINLVTLSGPAGTGKTLLAIAAAMQQVDHFDQILIAKPIVALAEKDLGFLPGDMIEKVRPYMQSIYDNINFLKNTCSNGSKDKLEKLLASYKIVVEPLAYIRGRTYANTILIVDEAQNLSPLEVKTIVTRMGENSKVIFTGDIYQIDDKYLDSTNNGLTYLIEKAKDYEYAAHINLVKGERSCLAEWGGKNL